MSLRPSTLSAALAAALAVAVAVPATAAAASPIRVTAKPVTTALSTKAAKTTVTVRNTGKRRVKGLRLQVRSVKGVKVAVGGAKRGRLNRSLKPLKGGRSVRVRVSLRSARGGAPRQGRLAVKVTRKGRTVARARLPFGAPGDPNSLAGRYFWGSLYTINGIEQNTLYFTGPNLVYTAATESAWPSCAAPSETCKPYSYEATTGQLVIDGKPATLTGRTLEFDEDTYFELGFPAPSARWETLITYSNSSGLCPLYCSYYTENLAFAADGRFVRDAVASGSGPIADWAAVPPDSKGTYEVRADHTLRLAFADGTERVETVGLFLADDGSLKPAGEGVVLGGDGYFDIRD